MDLSNKDLVKSLTSLIDDTLQEIEEIKKSKFAASEIKIEGPGDGIGGKPVNGDLHAKKEDKEEEEDESAEHEKGESEKEEKAEKSEEACKAEDEGSEDDEEEDEEEDKKKKKKFDIKDLKKSMASSEELMKSYVDSKFSAFEGRLEKMTAALESIANAPVSRKGVPAGVQPLAKSTEEIAPLNKGQIADKLFDLKKSGTRVDSSDIFKVETTRDSNELKQIADKYGIK